MDELGITGQWMNMLITADKCFGQLNSLIDTDNTAIDAGSDTNLSSDISINRMRWSSTNRLTINRSSGGGAFRDFWGATARGAYSAYFIVNDGTVVELPGSWIPGTSTIGSGYMRWDVPSSETTVIDATQILSRLDNCQIYSASQTPTRWVSLTKRLPPMRPSLSDTMRRPT